MNRQQRWFQQECGRGQGPHDAVPVVPEPDDLLERAQERLDRARGMAGGSNVELYHRSSVGIRVTRVGEEVAPRIEIGEDEGLAVRVHSVSKGTVGFAAASGDGDLTLDWVVGRARENAARVDCQNLWAEGSGRPRIDRDSPLELPDSAGLQSWLDQALGAASRLAGAPPRGIVWAWAECGSTVETLVADGGLAASRARTRVWAKILWTKDKADDRERPRTIHGRSLDTVDVAPWAQARSCPRHRDAEAFDCPVVFAGEAAATLVRALDSSFHRPESPIHSNIGPAWRVTDDPCHARGLSGGTFDDAGFPAAPKVLSDGTGIRGVIGGPGHFRRASFRDPPDAVPTTLVVHAECGSFPPDSIVLDFASIHATDPGQWVLEVDGTIVRGGRPYRSFNGAAIRTGPGALVRGLVSTAGPERFLERGVVSPALIVEGLALEI